jgi:hypothetical protein
MLAKWLAIRPKINIRRRYLQDAGINAKLIF